MNAAATDLLCSALSESSFSAYRQVFNCYKSFVHTHIQQGLHPLPPNLEHLIQFIAHCHLQGLAASTVCSYISALGYIFKLGSFADLSQHFIIRKILHGYNKKYGSSDSRLPITPPILITLLDSLKHTLSSAFLRSMFRAAYLVAFCAFLRIGEFTKTGKTQQHYLRLEHIRFSTDPTTNQSTVQISIPHYKHSNTRSPCPVFILHPNPSNPSLCPVQALSQFIIVRKHSSGSDPLFSFISGAPLSRQFFCKTLKSSLAWCGLDLHRYQSHSFRIGAACHAVARGVSETQLQVMGRWKSNAFRKYLRVPLINV